MIKINLILICLSAFFTFGQTTISDNSSVSGTWDLNGSPYIIEGRATINSGDNLTIQPGVEVLFNASASTSTSTWDFNNAFVGALKVEGTLTALGNVSDSIVFTRNGTNGNWGAVIIDQTAELNMEYCRVEYAKESRNIAGITNVVTLPGAVSFYQNTNNCSVKNSTFINNRIDGLYSFGVSNYQVEIDNNVINSNGRNGIYSSNSSILIRNNELTDNATTFTGNVAAIHLSESESFAVGNLIYNNNQFGFRVVSASSIVSHLVNNTIYNHNQGLRVEDNANVELINTIIFENTSNFVLGNANGTINAKNNLTNETTLPAEITDLGGNIVDANPEFVDVNQDDFQLESTSSAIDNGYADTANLNLLVLDILENNRVDNGIIDIGAIEYQSPVTYTVVTSVNPSSSGTTSGDGSYSENASVNIEATANTGYAFVNWTENGTEISTDASYTFSIQSNRDLVANFESVSSLPSEVIESLVIFPNPTSSFIHINSDHKWTNYTILGLDGKIVKSDKYSQLIDISELSAATYFIELHDNQSLVKKKFVKVDK